METRREDMSTGAPPSYDSALQRSKPSPRQGQGDVVSGGTPPLGYSPPSSKNAGVWLEPHADYAPRLTPKTSAASERRQQGRTLQKTESLPVEPLQEDSGPPAPALPARNRSPQSAKSKAASKLYRHWNPPMLGTLPDDFLRISVNPSRGRHQVSRSHSLPVNRRNGHDGHRSRHDRSRATSLMVRIDTRYNYH